MVRLMKTSIENVCQKIVKTLWLGLWRQQELRGGSQRKHQEPGPNPLPSARKNMKKDRPAKKPLCTLCVQRLSVNILTPSDSSSRSSLVLDKCTQGPPCCWPDFLVPGVATQIYSKHIFLGCLNCNYKYGLSKKTLFEMIWLILQCSAVYNCFITLMTFFRVPYFSAIFPFFSTFRIKLN